jgi:hypothetical protein
VKHHGQTNGQIAQESRSSERVFLFFAWQEKGYRALPYGPDGKFQFFSKGYEQKKIE